VKDCIFCKIGRHEARSWMVAETEHTCAKLNIHPMNKWHTLVMPKAHYENILDIPVDVLCEVMSTLKYVVDLYTGNWALMLCRLYQAMGKPLSRIFFTHTGILRRDIRVTIRI
jgi:histidine triad (HIT) family protein